MAKTFIERQLEMVTNELAGKDVYTVLNEIAERSKQNLILSEKDQSILGAVLGAILHQSYCDSRKLSEPNEDGLSNNPRLKKLEKDIDQDFIQDVKEGRIPTSPVLFIKDGNVYMDIANTDFVNLSPYWKKDNFMAGCAATRTVITALQYKELMENPQFRECAEVLIANAIHESWIARENVYYDEYNGEVYTNQPLNTAFIQLPKDEQLKDSEHFIMAKQLVENVYALMHEKNMEGSKKKPTEPSTPGEMGE